MQTLHTIKGKTVYLTWKYVRINHILSNNMLNNLLFSNVRIEYLFQNFKVCISNKVRNFVKVKDAYLIDILL